VEIQDPTSSSSKIGKAPAKGSSSSSKKGKKKATAGTGGIEDVTGSLNVGVSKSSAPPDQEPGAGENEDDNGDMYATEEEGVGEKGVGPPHKKRKPSQTDRGESINRPAEGRVELTPPPTSAAEPGLVQAQHQQPIPSDTAMAIDPALEALQGPGGINTDAS